MAIVDSSIRLRETDKIPLVEHNLTRYQLKTCLTVPPSHIYHLSVSQNQKFETSKIIIERNTGHLSWMGLVAGCKSGVGVGR